LSRGVTADLTDGAQALIAPIVGTHDQVETMAWENQISGAFTRSCLANLLAHDPVSTFSGHLASHQLFEIAMAKPIFATDESLAKVQGEMPKWPSGGRSAIRPTTTDYLHGAALARDEAELDRAIDLMGLAHFLRPKGWLIAVRLKQRRREHRRTDAEKYIHN
jgi:hypothetical protein